MKRSTGRPGLIEPMESRTLLSLAVAGVGGGVTPHVAQRDEAALRAVSCTPTDAPVALRATVAPRVIENEIKLLHAAMASLKFGALVGSAGAEIDRSPHSDDGSMPSN